MRRIGALLLAVCALLLLATPAAAALPDWAKDGEPPAWWPPQWDEVFTEEFEFTVPCEEFGYDFHLDHRATVTVKTWTRTDPQGNVTHEVERVIWRGTVTQSATGLTVPDNANYVAVFNHNRNWIAEVGVVYWIRIPGQGVVFREAGIIVYRPETLKVLFERGPHEYHYGGDPALCAAFA